MADRVLIHLGLPKTATTYLQTLCWSSRDRLAEHGVLLPGAERRDHLWSSRVIREDPNLTRAPQRHRTAWERVLRDLDEWPGTGLISHEFFAAASAAQARRMVADLAPAEVHLVVTAREPLGLFTASWQESLKNKHTTPIRRYATGVSDNPNAVWDWRTLDLRLVLERWSPTVPAGRVHVLPVDTAAPREDVWHRFADLLGVPADVVDLSGSFPNESMGVVEAETLRRVNQHLDAFHSAFDRGVYIRSFLADERLVPRRGERFWPPQERIVEQRRRGEEWVEYLADSGFDVRGDLDGLRVPAELGERRIPASVTHAEVADVAVWLVATMLGDVRELRRENARLRTELAAAEATPHGESPAARLRGRLRRRLGRLRRR